MFMADEPAAEAIRRAYEDGGELAGAVEFKRHFPLISDHRAGECARMIAGWAPVPKRRRGAGPAQLALAILAEVTGDNSLAVRLHQEFKRDVIAGLAMNRSWQINSREVREWLSIRAGELDGAER